ncbi:MAG TPA: POTRA domain-containing protein [Pirellulaceae bacterium]|nr:POTRA domain-containing protein [Pirellulaceae bacterium]HMP69065.1 POTRA domain-containing protein [Pirellulaceae bacterium]
MQKFKRILFAFINVVYRRFVANLSRIAKRIETATHIPLAADSVTFLLINVSLLILVLSSLGCAVNRSTNPTEDMTKWRFQDPGTSAAPAASKDIEPPLFDNRQSIDEETSSANKLNVHDQANRVREIRVTGNQRLATHQVLRSVRTRPGRYFDPDLLQQDVDSLWKERGIRRINGPYLERTPEGIIITIDIVEQQVVESVRFVGNRALSDRKLREESGVEPGQPLNRHSLQMAKQRITELYREKGYANTEVEIIESDAGGSSNDQSLVFLIHEDNQQKIFRVTFEGNTIVSDGRLRSFVKKKAGILWIFGGDLDRKAVDEDVLRLTSYYRNLGFFNARISRQLRPNQDNTWYTIHYIIDEGPRYRVRNVAFMGNQRFTDEQLLPVLELKPDDGEAPYFNAAIMNQDLQQLIDAYGTQGYVFADINAETLFLEEPGWIDLVYKISEGEPYRIGKINIVINGDYGVTKRQVVLNRLGLRPGDLIDTRQLRAAEARLHRSQLFTDGTGSSPGPPPKVSVRPPENNMQGSSYR